MGYLYEVDLNLAEKWNMKHLKADKYCKGIVFDIDNLSQSIDDEGK